MRSQGPHPAAWTTKFAAGHMPMWLALMFGLFGSFGLMLMVLLIESSLDGGLGTIEIGGRGVGISLLLFTLPSAAVTPIVARHKRRSPRWWSLFAFGALLVGLPLISFLPMALLLAITLSRRLPFKVPQPELEAAEDPKAMRQLVGVREELWKLYQQAEDRYVHRDFSVMVASGPLVAPVEKRLDAVREQVSERGSNARTHLQTATRQMAAISEEAAAVLEENGDSPERMAAAAQGSALRPKSKAEKSLLKRLRRIEILLNGAKIQIGVAGGLLEALGYSAAKADDIGQPFGPPASVEQTARAAQPPQDRPRVRRTPRRRRY